MPYRELPARPSLDHLKNKAKSLLKAHRAGDAAAVARMRQAIGEVQSPKLTDAQRALAREYGFFTWPQLRAHVESTASPAAAIDEFLRAIQQEDLGRALQVLESQPTIRASNLHIAAAVGDAASVRAQLAEHPDRVKQKAGKNAVQPLFVLCMSPFHGRSSEIDAGLLESARLLLAAGADPNATGQPFKLPPLYGVTGHRSVPAIAKLLLDAGANPTDGESIFHAAEHYRLDAMELLLAAGVQLNAVGEWGNTPLYFLLRWYDLEKRETVRKGVEWLLAHGANPNVKCGKLKESSLLVAIRRGQSMAAIQLLLDHGADVTSTRGDGLSAWRMAMRGGREDVAKIFESRGARPEQLSTADRLASACNRGNVIGARAAGGKAVISALSPDDRLLLIESTEGMRLDRVRACLAAGFPVDLVDEYGATALHHAAIAGSVEIVRELLSAGAPLEIVDRQHHSRPIGWACWGADFVRNPKGSYPETVRVLLAAGTLHTADDHQPEDPAVRQALADARQ